MTQLFQRRRLSPMISDPTCYIGHCIRVATHVDDYLIAVRAKKDLAELTQALEQNVEIDHKGQPNTFLNIECHWNDDTLSLTQTRAIRALCTEYEIGFGASTAMSPCADLTAPTEDEETIDKKRYQRLIGSLQYIAQTTRPDIAYAVSYLARRNEKATARHWEGAIRVVRYLFGTASKGHRLVAGTGVTVWVDASYGGDEEGRCQMGYVTCIGNTAVGWVSQRQPVVALSTTEAEYIAISAGAQHAAWMKNFLAELGENITPVIITDNDGARKLSENPGFHKRSKHINQRYHYIRQQLQLRELTVEWRAGKSNKADLLTKALPAPGLDRAASAVMIGQPLPAKPTEAPQQGGVLEMC
jgi:hypothetical protein